MSTRHDVAFYVPGVGSVLSTTASLPPGGAETQILMLAKALARQGHRVAIIAYGNPAELPDEVDGVTIVPRPPYRPHGPIIGKPAEIALIWRSLWQAPSSVIVTRCAGIQVGLVAAFARVARRRMVFSIANVVDFNCEKIMPKRRDQLLYRLGVHLADAIVVQTEEQVNLCVETFRRRPMLIKSISSITTRQMREPEAFLWVGRLARYKRPLEYVELARALPDAKFWMVGVPVAHSRESERLRDTVSRAAAELPNLELMPPRSQSEIGELMSRAVASVNTAEFEGMPNVLLEAWSRGVPALALSHDPGGVIKAFGLGGFADGSRETLRLLAREQWRDRGDRHDLSQRCRAYIAQHHAPESVAAKWRAVLQIAGPTEPTDATADGETTLTCVG